MGEVRNFKKFLEDSGVLREWIELRLELMGGTRRWNELARGDPASWLLLSAYNFPSWYGRYNHLDQKWCALCGTSWALRKARVPVEPGVPLDDQLGLRMVLAELEKEDG